MSLDSKPLGEEGHEFDVVFRYIAGKPTNKPMGRKPKPITGTDMHMMGLTGSWKMKKNWSMVQLWCNVLTVDSGITEGRMDGFFR